jgi:hypothetical protein
MILRLDSAVIKKRFMMLKLFWLCLCLTLCSACSVTDTIIVKTGDSSSANTNSSSEQTEVCTVTPTVDVTAYQRPSVEAPVFGVLSKGESTVITGKTTDGWFAFDPGIAQAANVGPFRYRWFENGEAVRLEGDCSELPIVVGPATGVCFAMAGHDVPIRAQPDATAAIVATMRYGDYTEVVGRLGEWLEVDVRVGSLQGEGLGWLLSDDVDFNGPCDAPPTLPK